VNRGGGGECVFITATVLDFVHAFAREEPRDALVSVIKGECRRTGSRLHAYVVMPHHLHMVLNLPEKLDQRKFMAGFKPRSSARIKPLLTQDERDAFSEQTGLNRNTFWQRSFRGLVIETPAFFWQKVKYVHENPRRAGYVENPAEYRWSSAHEWEAGRWDEAEGLSI